MLCHSLLCRATLLGSVNVQEARGNEVTVEAVDKVKRQGVPPTKVFVVVTATDIKVINVDTQAEVQSSPIGQVVYTGLNPVDKKVFVYTTRLYFLFSAFY